MLMTGHSTGGPPGGGKGMGLMPARRTALAEQV